MTLRSQPLVEKLLEKVHISSKCWLFQGALSPDGYGCMFVDKKHVSAHRLAYLLFCGDIPKRMHVLHKCDTPNCVRPSHLFLGTHLENMRDMYTKERRPHPRGERNGNSKLTQAQALEILLSSGPAEIFTKKFGISANTVCNIRTGKRWKHLDVNNQG